jgi:hypothetical protein
MKGGIDRFSSGGREQHIRRRRTEQLCDLVSSGLNGRPGLSTWRVCTVGVTRHFPEKREHGCEDLRENRGRGVVVEVNATRKTAIHIARSTSVHSISPVTSPAKKSNFATRHPGALAHRRSRLRSQGKDLNGVPVFSILPHSSGEIRDHPTYPFETRGSPAPRSASKVMMLVKAAACCLGAHASTPRSEK